jgi:hypothetical protein
MAKQRTKIRKPTARAPTSIIEATCVPLRIKAEAAGARLPQLRRRSRDVQAAHRVFRPQGNI